ncbi:GntR family transcriptional regulator [Paenibacillus sp. S3N08]|uniref:GntR family transcriptional regulator n=1 Tax=Paenibacillus agricola TaxID=2716264 RepID=A0ABX0JHN8_9BACL|nr:GntR family transcriptional regulator [Paenibacillus agricola]
MLNGPIVLKTLTDEVYRRIRLSLFQNLYKPGEQIDIGQISTQLNVSRQPVKEALNRLAQEGLMEIRPRVGTFVRKFNRIDVLNIMEARRMIEVFAVTNGTVDPESLQALEKETELMNQMSEKKSFEYLAYNDADHKFHMLLVGLSRNEILVNSFVQLNTHYITARAFYANAFERMISQYAQHTEILHHLQQGDTYKAVAIVDAHIRRAQSELLKIFID